MNGGVFAPAAIPCLLEPDRYWLAMLTPWFVVRSQSEPAIGKLAPADTRPADALISFSSRFELHSGQAGFSFAATSNSNSESQLEH